MALVIRSLNIALSGLCLLLFAGAAAVAHAADKCYDCHSTLGDTPSTQFRDDVHHREGIPCAGCHGGDPSTDDMDKAMSKDAGFLGVPKGDEISARCASCHADSSKMSSFGVSLPTNQYASLRESVHGRESVSGKGSIAQCTTCHHAHGILPVDDPRSPVNHANVVALCASCHSKAAFIREYNPSLPIDQLDKYKTSVHGILYAKGDKKVAVCVSCHGSHDIFSAKDVRSKVYPTNIPGTCRTCHGNAEYMKQYGIPTNQYEEYASSVHGIALLKNNDLGAPACNGCHGNHGATPPGVESISAVCGTCHAMNAELFSKSPHKRAFDAAGIPECQICHGNHAIKPPTDAMLGTDSAAVCSQCHTPDDGSTGYATAHAMRSLMDSVSHAEEVADQLVGEAEQKGMEISEAKFKLRDARQFRLQARTMVHSFDEAQFETVARKSLDVSLDVEHVAQGALDEYVFRRTGLGISTLIITILALALFLTIRKVEKSGNGTKKT
jgi:predicted CXXCH cytochrome family protein